MVNWEYVNRISDRRKNWIDESTHRMPLELGDLRNLDEEPLAGCVLEAGLLDTELHRTTRVDKDSLELSLAAGTELAVHAFAKVDDPRPDGEAPAEVADAMAGVVEREGGLEVGQGAVTHEAAGGVGVDAEHEEEGEVVGVPERFKTLVTDLLMRRRVHQNHDEEHEVASDTARLSVVDVECLFRTNL